jgi:Domain of unknown function (DUF397)
MTQPPGTSELSWRKSSRSQEHGACVEIAPLPSSVAIRDSKDPQGPALAFDHAAWRTFTEGLKNDPTR